MISGTHGQDEVITSKKKSISNKWYISISAILFVAYLLMPTMKQWYFSIPTVEAKELIMSQVTKGDLIRDVAVNGKVVAANAPQLYSPEEGQVTLIAKPGESVNKNQVVASIYSPELKALIKQQRSTLEQLKIDSKRSELENREAQLNLEGQLNTALSELNVAIREKERAEISYEKQVISEVDWLKAKDRLDDANRNFNHDEKRVELAKEKLQFEQQNRVFLVEKQQLILDELLRRESSLTILAPVTGVVGNWLVAQKNNVPANQAIMSIVDLSEYEAELSVPEFYADDLGIGLPVSMKINNHIITGSVIAISPEIEGSQVQVRAKLNNNLDLQLRQNQRLNARNEFEKKSDVLMVKKGAFVGSMGGKFAYRLTNSQLAEQVAIEVGSSSVDYIELLAGVSEGDTLIISDYEKFNQAQQISLE